MNFITNTLEQNITTVLSFIYRHRLWHKFFLQTQIESDDVYEDFYENKSFFDFCDYPEDSKFFDPVYEKLLRKMKDEFKGK